MPRTTARSSTTAETPPAPWFPVPAQSVLSVEHPYLVKNIGKAIEMVGGHTAINEALQDPTGSALNLRFHPENLTNRPVISVNMKTNNVLLKVTVPKRTGRKRKRGSLEPFVEDIIAEPPCKDARYLLRSLQDKPEDYLIEPTGRIENTHVWRSMPDFVYSLAGSKFISNFRDKLTHFHYPDIKSWSLGQSVGLEDTETFPPPVLSITHTTTNYSYRQNPAVKAVTDQVTGRTTLHNTQAPIKIHTIQCLWDEPHFPTAPPDNCPPLETQPHNLQLLAALVTRTFAQRPIWTRRALINQFPPQTPIFLARYVVVYAAYAIRSGPWRDTYVAYGHDPRTDPKYRKYQTVLLQLAGRGTKKTDEKTEYFARKWSRPANDHSHIFTGTGLVPEDGKVWQLCDIQDPQIKQLVDVPDRYLRAECEGRYFGWYANGTNSKMRVVLKAKVDYLTDHKGVPEDPAEYEQFLALPEQWDGPTRDKNGKVVEDVVLGYLGKNATKRQLEWAAAYRSMCRTPPGQPPLNVTKGRLSKSKPATRESYLDPEREKAANRPAESRSQDFDDDAIAAAAEYAAPPDGEEDELEDEDDADELDEVGSQSHSQTPDDLISTPLQSTKQPKHDIMDLEEETDDNLNPYASGTESMSASEDAQPGDQTLGGQEDEDEDNQGNGAEDDTNMYDSD